MNGNKDSCSTIWVYVLHSSSHWIAHR